MDKAFAKMQDIRDVLELLEDQNLENNKKIDELSKNNYDLELNIKILKRVNEHLNYEKLNIQNAPSNRKRDKKGLITSLILMYIFLTLIALFPVLVSGASLILPCIGTSTLVAALAASIVVPVQFKTINKKYPIGNTENIESEISQNNIRIQKTKEKQLSVEEEIGKLEVIRKSLETKIHNMENELKNLKCLRFKALIDYCKGNLELEEKINIAYDDDVKNKEKVK